MKVYVLTETPIMEAANDVPQPMSRAVREMLHALCRLTGQPYQPGQSQDIALMQIERMRDVVAARRSMS